MDGLLLDGVDGGEDLDAVDHTLVEFALFEGSLFHHLAECYPVQTVEFSWRLADNCGSSRSIVHKCQLPKGLSMSIGL